MAYLFICHCVCRRHEQLLESLIAYLTSTRERKYCRHGILDCNIKRVQAIERSVCNNSIGQKNRQIIAPFAFFHCICSSPIIDFALLPSYTLSARKKQGDPCSLELPSCMQSLHETKRKDCKFFAAQFALATRAGQGNHVCYIRSCQKRLRAIPFR